LRDDYRILDRLARVLTSLAPAANQQREIQRILLAWQFEFRWRMLGLEIWTGARPVTQLQSMAGPSAHWPLECKRNESLQESARPTSVALNDNRFR